MVYSFIIGFYCVFAFKLFQSSGQKIHLAPWLPFYSYIILRYILQGNIEFACYWFVAFVVVAISSSDNLTYKVPYKLLLFSSLFCVLGEFLQLLMPSWFNSHVSNIYLNDNVEMWAMSEYGLGGFTYQLATTAELLIIGECVLLAKIIVGKGKNWLWIICLLLIIVSVFMTGKRMNSAISLFIVLVAYIINKKGGLSFKRITQILFILSICVVGVVVFLNNADSFIDDPFVRRLATSAIEAKSGGDFSDGRDELWSKAWALYNNNKVFGIGPSQYPKISHMEMDVHNVYIQTLCELGIIGFVFLIFGIAYCLIKTMKLLIRSNKTPLFNHVVLSLLIQIVYIIEGYSENVNTNLQSYMIYSLAIGIMFDCENKLKLYEYKTTPLRQSLDTRVPSE